MINTIMLLIHSIGSNIVFDNIVIAARELVSFVPL